MSTEPIEPRTDAQIMADLAHEVVEGQWRAEKNTSCHCHPEYEPCCPECGNMKDWGHKPSCRLVRLVNEARGLLLVYNEQVERRLGTEVAFSDFVEVPEALLVTDEEKYQ